MLVRCRLNRLSHVDRATGEPIRRYEHEHPGALLHVDVKKLGNIPDGGGWRYVGRSRARRTARDPRPHRQHATPLPRPRSGTAFVHTVIDDHSRVAYAEIHDDETAATAIAVLRHAVAWFAARGVTVERVLSDNGAAYRSPPLARHLRRARHHPKTDPALPAPDQRQDRTLPPHPGRRLGLQEALHSETARRAALPAWLHEYNHHRPHTAIGKVTTHHPVDQPGRAVQLALRRTSTSEGLDTLDHPRGGRGIPAPVREACGRLGA